MTERHEPEQTPRGESEDPGGAAMDRFRDLTRGLLKVTPEQLREERDRYESVKAERGTTKSSE